nr:hypothetical protein [Burkholderia metallica]
MPAAASGREAQQRREPDRHGDRRQTADAGGRERRTDRQREKQHFERQCDGQDDAAFVARGERDAEHEAVDDEIDRGDDDEAHGQPRRLEARLDRAGQRTDREHQRETEHETDDDRKQRVRAVLRQQFERRGREHDAAGEMLDDAGRFRAGRAPGGGDGAETGGQQRR